MKTPTIKTKLIEDISKKNSDTVYLMLTAQKTIDSYPEEWIHIYTDGSAFKGIMNAGYGSRINFPGLTCEELFDACGAYKSNYEAEARAIEATLHRLSDIFTQKEKEIDDIVIFSDTKSVLEALENENSKDQKTLTYYWKCYC